MSIGVRNAIATWRGVTSGMPWARFRHAIETAGGLAGEAAGYGAAMEIMGRFRNRPAVAETTADDGHFVLIETDEHEQIVLSGASDAEMQAKLDDFLTWAS